MKSRTIRALAIGAALLVPVGSLTLLGVGVAGATITLATATSKDCLGSFGCIALAGVTVNDTSTTSAAWRGAAGLAVSGSSGITAGISASQKTTSIRVGTTNATEVKILSGVVVTLTQTGATTHKNGCVIMISTAVTLVRVPKTLKWNGTKTISSTKVAVTGCSLAATDTAIKADIAGAKITVTQI
jgi:hypothetical protein